MSRERALWLWLHRVLGPCTAKFRPLMAEFEFIETVYEKRGSNVLALVLDPAQMKTARELTLDTCERDLEVWREQGIEMVTYADDAYPQRLRDTRIPPVALFVTGNAAALTGDAVAGVGARYSTQYGRDAVEAIMAPLAKLGITLVSGLAYGIDAEVHKTALRSNAPTVAVLGNAIDQTYPASHRDLRYAIEGAGGAVVSEYPPGTPSQRWMFPQRNRIVSGLSRGVIIFEAAKRSGTMITANWALDDGREVFAVPGSIFSPNCEGTNHLICQGAIPATSGMDVLEGLGLSDALAMAQKQEKKKQTPTLTADQKAIAEQLRLKGELSVDDLLEGAGLMPHILFANLTQMEVDGVIEALPGSRYRLR